PNIDTAKDRPLCKFDSSISSQMICAFVSIRQFLQFVSISCELLRLSIDNLKEPFATPQQISSFLPADWQGIRCDSRDESRFTRSKGQRKEAVEQAGGGDCAASSQGWATVSVRSVPI